MGLFVNRSLNLKSIKAIGFDMDHTLVRYNVEAFEKFTYHQMLKNLVKVKDYPTEVLKLEFDYSKSIQGLVIDKKKGNILKLNRYGKVKEALHGSDKIEFKVLKKLYSGRVIDLTDFNVQSLDTNFSISNGVLFAQLIDLKNAGKALPSFEVIAEDLKEVLDLCHRDGSIKAEVAKNKEKYLVKDAGVVELLLNLKAFDKKIMVITNSDIHYTKELLDYAINPFLDDSQTWDTLFDIVITFSRKPRFFLEKNDFLKIDLSTLKKSVFKEKIVKGIYEGGNAFKLQEDLGFYGEDFLYFGDHIYGDVVALKKTLNWRTALVLDPLESELIAMHKTRKVQTEIDEMMEQKVELEKKLDQYYAQLMIEKNAKVQNKIDQCFTEIRKLDGKLSKLIQRYQKHFNPNWGELMRAGSEESRFADQVEKYACIYMIKISELNQYSPRHYFRPKKRELPHEMFF